MIVFQKIESGKGGQRRKRKKRKCPGLLTNRNFVSAKLVRSESPLIAGYFIDFGVEYQRACPDNREGTEGG
jgi:hypothetical protein